MNSKKRIYSSIIIVLLLIAVVSSTTFAVYKWRSTTGLNVSINVTDNIIITFNGGTNITGRLIPVANAYEGIVKEMSVKANLPSSDTFNLYLKVNTLPDELKSAQFRWRLTGCDLSGDCITISPDVSGNFSTTSMSDYIDQTSGDMLLLEDQAIPYRSTLKLYLYLWIDGTVDNNVNMGSKSIDFDLYVTGNTEGTLAGNS